jgi:hypothetical protein
MISVALEVLDASYKCSTDLDLGYCEQDARYLQCLNLVSSFKSRRIQRMCPLLDIFSLMSE